MNNFRHFKERDWIWFSTASLLYFLSVVCAIICVATGWSWLALVCIVPGWICAYFMVEIHNRGADGVERMMKEYLDED